MTDITWACSEEGDPEFGCDSQCETCPHHELNVIRALRARVAELEQKLKSYEGQNV